LSGVDTEKEVGPLNERKLRVKYELEKGEYLVAEPIVLTVWLENYGTKTEYYRRKDVGEFDLYDKEANKLKFSGRVFAESRLHREFVSGVGNGYFKAVKPGESTEKQRMNILDSYGSGQGGMDFYLVTGSYTATARHLLSDTSSFNVVSPKTTSDSAAMQLLIYAAENTYSEVGSYEQTYQFYAAFVEKYPNSVYTPRALRQLLSVSSVETPGFDEVRKQYYARYMITRFPESGFVWEALVDLNPAMVTVGEKASLVEGLQKAKASSPSESLQRLAEDLIGELEK